MKQNPDRAGRFKPRDLTRLATALLAAVLVGALQAQPRPAPDFALKTVSGVNLRLSEHRGQVVVLAFWSASSCSECRELLEIMQSLHGQIAGTDTVIMGISVDRSDKRAARASAGVAKSYPILLDVKQDVVKAYEIAKIPSVLIVDRDGMIVRTFEGSAVVNTEFGPVVRAVAER